MMIGDRDDPTTTVRTFTYYHVPSTTLLHLQTRLYVSQVQLKYVSITTTSMYYRSRIYCLREPSLDYSHTMPHRRTRTVYLHSAVRG